MSKALTEMEQIFEDLMKTPVGRRKFLASMGFLLASCATGEKSRLREGDNSGQDISLTPDDERRLTEEALPSMRKEYPPLNHPQLQNYVSSLGNKLVLANNLNNNPYRYTFGVVDVGYVNAFALPAGTVFVTAPLIAMAETEAELAGVIGHEIGHIRARHTAERMAVAKKSEGNSWLYGAGGGILGGVLGYGLGRAACPPKDDACIRRAAELGVIAGVGGGLLVQKYKFMANSREDEMEADRIGFRVATRGGYSKDAVGTFYSKLLKMEKGSKGQSPAFMQTLQDALSTHPPSQERVNQMNEMAAQTPADNRAIVSTNEFAAAKQWVAALPKKTQG